MTRDPDPTPPHGIPRPPALAPTDIDRARAFVREVMGGTSPEVARDLATLAQVLDLVEGFAASYFADDAVGVDLYAEEAGALSVFRACEDCRTWQDRADLDLFGLCEWCRDKEDEDGEDDLTPSPWERVADARRLSGGPDFAGTVCADCSAPLDEFACPTCSEVDGLCCECCDCADLDTDTPHPFGGALDR